MKKLPLLSAVAALAVLTICPLRGADCGTTVSGIIDGEIWTAAGSPYCVIGDVLVSALMIQPGVEVRFLSNYVFIVEGVLQVKGTAANQVRFTTTNSAVGWPGIWFIDSVPGSFFNYCTIEYSRSSAVYITNGAPVGGGVPTFTNCMIINNSSPEYGGGIDATLNSGDLILNNCVIGNNTCGIHGGGINAILRKGTLKMVHCTVVSNVANAAAGSSTYVGGGIRVSGNSVFLNCTNSDNLCRAGSGAYTYGGGIYSDSGDALFRNCWFLRNVCGGNSRAWGGAVFFQDGHLTMQNCIVLTNITSPSSSPAGAGIFVNSSGTVDVINSTILANNTQGAYGYNGGTVNCLNSIIFLNNDGASQFAGAVTATWCDVQGGYPGEGNKAVSPNLRPGTLELLSSSPLIDMGNPDPLYYERCFTPPMLFASKGTEVNDMGAYGGPAACCWANPCGPPVITSQPKNLATCVNSSAMFCVSAIGDEPLRYQWRFHGTNVTNAATNLLGATNSCLLISNVQSNNAGYYSVLAANAFGTAESSTALLTVTPACVDINLYAGLTITGGVTGRAYRVQYVTNIEDTTWTTLTTITQELSGVFVLDPEPANRPRKFYRVVP